jgi:hypothetical protein
MTSLYAEYLAKLAARPAWASETTKLDEDTALIYTPAGHSIVSTKFYVYLYRDPRPDKKLAPIYVGKGQGARAQQHLRDQARGNPLLRRILAKCKTLNLEPIIEIVERFASENDAFELEIALIAKYGRRDLCIGTLCNLTDGGEGPSGAVNLEQWNAKATAAKANIEHWETVRDDAGCAIKQCAQKIKAAVAARRAAFRERKRLHREYMALAEERRKVFEARRRYYRSAPEQEASKNVLWSRETRLGLLARSKPYFHKTSVPGLNLGYRRLKGQAGTWTVRKADGKGGSNWTRIGIADDFVDANGIDVLSFDQAKAITIQGTAP